MPRLDICKEEVLRALLQDNPELLLVTSKRGCRPCDVLAKAAEKVADSKGIGFLELKAEPVLDASCPALEQGLRLSLADPGEAVYIKGGKVVGRHRALGFEPADLEALQKLVAGG